jgi:hypothetical protein
LPNQSAVDREPNTVAKLATQPEPRTCRRPRRRALRHPLATASNTKA